MKTDTIAAIATAMTSSGIGIIRISGGQAFEVIEKIFKKKNGGKIDLSRSHTVQYRYIRTGRYGICSDPIPSSTDISVIRTR